MTGEVYGSTGYIFKAQLAFLASFLSPHKSGPAKGRDVREAVWSKNACLIEHGKIRHAAAHFVLGQPACCRSSGRVPGLQDRLIRRILPTGFPDASILTPFFPQFAKAQKKKGVGTGRPTP